MIERHPLLQPRPARRFPRRLGIPEDELENPKVCTVFKLIGHMVHYLFHEPVGMIMGSAMVVLMIWGYHGGVQLLGVVWKAWQGPGSCPSTRERILQGIPWDQEWISWAIGAVVVVLIPCWLIKRIYRHKLSDYGLGLPKPGRWKLTFLSSGLLLAVGFPLVVGATLQYASMRKVYPLYRGGFSGMGAFLTYELGYFVFFLVIEFIFRGYLLFGLYRAQADAEPPGTTATGLPGRFRFGFYAILISMLSYTAWHLGKPLPELWSTLVWGVAAGAVVLQIGSIWPIVIVHWLMNVGQDFVIWRFFSSSCTGC
jgi:hypothetical protein